MSRLFTSGGQSIGVSASASVLPMNIQNVHGENRTKYKFDTCAWSCFSRCSVARSLPTLCNLMTAPNQALLFSLSLSLLKLMPVRKVMPSLHPILWHPILLLPSFFPGIEFFSNKLALIRWPRDWRFRFTICPFNEYSGLVSFKIDCFDLLAVQGSSRVFSSTIVRKYQLFGAQPSLSSSHHTIFLLSHPFMTTGKTIALTRRTFVDKVMSLILNMLSRLVITFLPRSKSLLISWLQSPSAVILEPPQNKV